MADTGVVTDPFSLAPAIETHLDASPLVAALFQVKLPANLSKLTALLGGPVLADALNQDYPYSQQISNIGILFQPGQEPQQQAAAGVSWAYLDKSRQWRAEFSSDSISLTTSAYTSREDFCTRAERLLATLQNLVNPPNYSRLGIRYINRTHGDDLLHWVSKLTDPAIGLLRDLDEDAAANVIHALSDVRYSWPSDGAVLHGRWGITPPNAVLDAAMPPISEPSWVLDIDVFSEEPKDFDTTEVSSRLRDFASRAHTFFRWVVPNDALVRFRPSDKT